MPETIFRQLRTPLPFPALGANLCEISSPDSVLLISPPTRSVDPLPLPPLLLLPMLSRYDALVSSVAFAITAKDYSPVTLSTPQ